MVRVEINGKIKNIECDLLKLARTMWGKEGEKYTEEEMFKMGFKKKVYKDKMAKGKKRI